VFLFLDLLLFAFFPLVFDQIQSLVFFETFCDVFRKLIYVWSKRVRGVFLDQMSFEINEFLSVCRANEVLEFVQSTGERLLVQSLSLLLHFDQTLVDDC